MGEFYFLHLKFPMADGAVNWEENENVEFHYAPGVTLQQFGTKQLLGNKYDYDEVQVENKALEAQIFVKQNKAQVVIPHTAGRYNKRAFLKTECPIIERLVNSLMFQGRNTGKKTMAINHCMKALEIIQLRTNKNPVAVFVDAVQNAAAREDKARVGKSSMSKPAAVDVAPFRALNKAIYYMCAGARKASRRSHKTFYENLADEIMNTEQMSPSSFAIKKRDEIERTAAASR